MRGAGSAFWLESKDFENFCGYENQLNHLVMEPSMTMLCAHSVPARSARELLGIAYGHNYSITTHNG